MRLPFQKQDPQQNPRSFSASAPVPLSGDDAAGAARTSARRRLIGAFVLLAAAVVGFPLFFETQPRPPSSNPNALVARSDPGHGPRASSPAGLQAPSAPLPSLASARPSTTTEPLAREAAPAADAASSPSVQPPARNEGVAATAPTPALTSAPAPAPSPSPSPVPAIERAPAVPASRAAPAAPAASARAGTARATTAPAVAPAAAPGPKPSPTPPATQAQTRTQALAPSAPPAAALAEPSREGRFTVQVGAYADAATLRDTRQKVEKLGLTTYTQVIEGDAGKRTRVRVGPFATRAEAEAAATKLKAAGLPANLLTL